MKSFIRCMLDGTLKYPEDLEKIEDFINQWHDKLVDMDLHDFLGLTWKEYVEWVENPGKLFEIVRNKLESFSRDENVSDHPVYIVEEHYLQYYEKYDSISFEEKMSSSEKYLNLVKWAHPIVSYGNVSLFMYGHILIVKRVVQENTDSGTLEYFMPRHSKEGRCL